MMTTTLVFLFWFAVALILFSYLLYPVILIFISAIRQVFLDSKQLFSKAERRVSELNELPDLAVVFSAYNEEKNISERIKNLLALDYPADKINIYVGNDGSSDNTADLVDQFDNPRINFLNFCDNRGKASVLNDLLEQVDEELVIFTDANTHFQADAARKLARQFGDPEVGAVCGELNLVDSQSQENKDGMYWKYERLLKFHEGRLNCLLGANGAIYCIRRELWQAIPADTATDDFTIAIRIAMDGYRVVYDQEALAIEEVAPDSAGEYKRRVRIGMGNYQACRRCLSLLSPTYGLLWFAYVSHKLLRWFTPHALLTMLISSTLLSFDSVFYLTLTTAQAGAYAMAIFYQDKKLPFGLLQLPVFWINMNIALAHGFIKYCKGGTAGSWARTDR